MRREKNIRIVGKKKREVDIDKLVVAVVQLARQLNASEPKEAK